MKTTEEIKLVFTSERIRLYLEFPTEKSDFFTVWENDMGHSYKTIKECFDHMDKEYKGLKLESLKVAHKITFEV